MPYLTEEHVNGIPKEPESMVDKERCRRTVSACVHEPRYIISLPPSLYRNAVSSLLQLRTIWSHMKLQET